MQRRLLTFPAVVLVVALGLAFAVLYATRTTTLPDPVEPNRGLDIRDVCPAVDAAGYYFPPGALAPDPERQRGREAWYSRMLRAMNEPSLSCGPTEATEEYRFLWLRTFHRPIAVRVWNGAGGPHLIAIQTTGRGGYEPGGVEKQVRKALSQEDWHTVVASVKSARLWSTPTEIEQRAGLDGAQWIVEGRRAGRYIVEDVWAPPDGGDRQLGLRFLHLAGMPIPNDELY